MCREIVLDNEHLLLEVEVSEDNFLYLHCQVFKWSKKMYSLYLSWFVEILEVLKEKGVKEIFVCVPCDKPKTARFARMFGFDMKYKTKQHLIGVMEV